MIREETRNHAAMTGGTPGGRVQKKEYDVFRCTLKVFFLALAAWWLCAIHPGPAFSQEGPSIAVEEEDDVSDAEADDEDAPAGPAIDMGPDEPAEPDEPSNDEPLVDDPEMPADIPEDQAELFEEVRELREIVERLRQEADARERLRVTDEEERDEEEEILEAAGREYMLMPAGMLGMELNINYAYYSTDQFRPRAGEVEYRSNHNITNSLIIESARRDNLTIDASIPFIYKYDQVGTDRSMDVTNLGDISLGARYQPFKAGNRWPPPILNLRLTLPTSRGDYDINPQRELSTGSGLYALSGGVSVSQPIDPVNAYASLNYRHRFTYDDVGQRRPAGLLEKVDPGDRISGSMGFGYAVSYRASMSISFSYTYGFSTELYYANGDTQSTGDQISASMNINTSWRIRPGRTVIIGLSKGLTNEDPDFAFSVRLPIEFDLR